MSEQNVEIVRMLVDRFRNGETDVFEHYDPEIEWDARRGADLVPEIGNLYHGHDGVRAFWREWLVAWEPIESWSYELRESGDSVVVLISAQRNRGRRSGVEVEMPPYALVFTLSDRKVTRWALYSDQAEALEAVGLSGSP